MLGQMKSFLDIMSTYLLSVVALNEYCDGDISDEVDAHHAATRAGAVEGPF